MRSSTTPCFAPLRLISASILMLSFFAQPASAAPVGDYQGWLWETGILIDSDFTEEACFGQLDIPIAGDLNWTLSLLDEVCWGRTTLNTGRVANNFPPFVVDNFEPDQSTQPLVSAGGNLYEMYGQEFDGLVGLGEERVITLLSAPSNDNLLVGGTYSSYADGFGQEYFRSIAVLVKSTTAVQEARVAADLEGTTWRGSWYSHSLSDTNINAEIAHASISTLNLETEGVCSYSNANVIPEFVDNGDIFVGVQFDLGSDFDSRFVQGGADERNHSNCTWSIDGDDYLQVTRTTTRALDPNNPTVSSTRYVVSDDNRHVVLAPSLAPEDSTQALLVGYRAASGLDSNGVDKTYFFYVSISEFGADGDGAAVAGFNSRDWQELDLQGRGQITLSTIAGTTPAAENPLDGPWYSCSIDMVTNENEHELTGSTGAASVALGGFFAETADLQFTECDYRMDADGGISTRIFLPDDADPADDFEALLRGYVNDNGEIISMIFGAIEGNPLNDYKDSTFILHLLGMQYSGDPNADADADGLTNYEEFKVPLPAVASVSSDLNSDGTSDILWRNSASGVLSYWEMVGGAKSSSASFGVVSDLTWQIVGNGDYDGDGKADILWRNNVSGVLAYWKMDGGSVSSSTNFAVVSDLNWQTIGDGDYDGDGKADILWRNSASGVLAYWKMDGGTVSSSANFAVVSDLTWQPVGNGDYNGDGKADILWRNNVSGVLSYWQMDGGSITSSASFAIVSDLTWQTVGDGDYNGDGTSDILWRNNVSGVLSYWQMNGGNATSSSSFGVVSDLTWQIESDGDYNGDGSADILWQNNVSGVLAYWQMDGSTVTSSANFAVVSDLSWQITDPD